jgi:hypothetical protein
MGCRMTGLFATRALVSGARGYGLIRGIGGNGAGVRETRII